MKEEKIIKRWMKRKMSFTISILVTFLITGLISYGADQEVEKLKTEVEKLKKQLSTILVTENSNNGSERKSNTLGAVQVGHRAVSYNENGIAIGEGSGVWPEGRGATGIGGIAIGISAGSHLMPKAAHEQIIAFNHKDDTNKMVGGIAIGYKTHARIGSVDLGNRDYIGAIGDIEYGKDPMTNVNVIDGVGSTTVGTNSINSGNFSSINGAYNVISNRPTKGGIWGFFSNISRATQGFGSTISGTFNSIENNFPDGFAYSGMASSIVGIGNRVNKSNATLIMGAGNEVTNSYLDYAIGGMSSKDTIKEMADAIRKNASEGRMGSIAVIGGGNKVDYAALSSVMGVGNELLGTENSYLNNTVRKGEVKELTGISAYNFITGYENKGRNVNNTMITGTQNTLTNVKESAVIGMKNTFENIDNIFVLGNDVKGNIGNSVYLGSGSTVVANKGENLNSAGDSGSTTTAGATGTVEKAKIGEVGKEITYSGFAGKKAVGGITVGSSGAERRIMNVAAGEISNTSTDAINGSQLYVIVKELNEKITTPIPTPTPVAKIEVQNGKNTTVTKVGDDIYKVDVKGDLDEISSIKNGETKVSLAKEKKEVNVNGSKITNVAPGKVSDDSTEAVNGSQLKDFADKVGIKANENGKFDAPTFNKLKNKKGEDVIPTAPTTIVSTVNNVIDTVNKGLNFAGNSGAEAQQLGSKVSIVGSEKDSKSTYSSNNITTTYSKDEEGNGKVLIEMKENPTFAGDVTSKTGIKVENGPSMTKDGIDVANKKITNVEAGTEDKDAVNVSQLKTVANNMAENYNALNTKVDALGNKVNKGLAAAAAMSGIEFMEIGINQATVAAAVGGYKGTQAVAVGMQAAPTENTRINAKVSLTPGAKTEGLYSVGAAYRFNWK